MTPPAGTLAVMDPVTVLVCGSREWRWQEPVVAALDAVAATTGDLILIQGDARGADAYAKAWARRNRVRRGDHPADWKRYGKAAGPIRNREMLAVLVAHRDRGRRIVVLAFRCDGKSDGTDDMVELCRRAGFHGKTVHQPRPVDG